MTDTHEEIWVVNKKNEISTPEAIDIFNKYRHLNYLNNSLRRAIENVAIDDGEPVRVRIKVTVEVEELPLQDWVDLEYYLCKNYAGNEVVMCVKPADSYKLTEYFTVINRIEGNKLSEYFENTLTDNYPIQLQFKIFEPRWYACRVSGSSTYSLVRACSEDEIRVTIPMAENWMPLSDSHVCELRRQFKGGIPRQMLEELES